MGFGAENGVTTGIKSTKSLGRQFDAIRSVAPQELAEAVVTPSIKYKTCAVQ